jgi:DNA-binding transcriptional MerR regulator
MNASFARAYLGIGEVLVELRAEFPDISVSKIRFLESEGLISPARSPSGFRRFSPADVDQLRFILTAQRDEYLPLRVIRERLADRQVPSPGQPGSQPAEMVTRSQFLEAAGIDEKQLAELETHGLIKRSGRLYSQEALDVATTVAVLARYGVQPRNLRMVATAVDRDISLVEQIAGPTLKQRGPEARQTAGRTAHEIATLLLRLHRRLLEVALAEAGLADGINAMLAHNSEGCTLARECLWHEREQKPQRTNTPVSTTAVGLEAQVRTESQ